LDMFKNFSYFVLEMQSNNEFRESIENRYGNRVNTLSDLSGALDLQVKFFNEAIENRALYPYITLLEIALEMVADENGSRADALRDLLRQNGPSIVQVPILNNYKLSLGMSVDQIPYFMDIIKSNTSEMKKQITSFGYVANHVMNQIEFDVLPDPLFGRTYMKHGKIILNTNSERPGYYIFDAVSNMCKNCNKEHGIRLEQINEVPFRSLEKAFEKLDRSVIQTVVIAKNTEEYLLRETALPMVEFKYNQALGFLDRH